MRRICFICSGNVCRSITAEILLRQMIIEQGLNDVSVFSMGTSNIGQQPCDGMMARIAMSYGYEMTGTSTFMSKDTLMEADLILVMTYTHMMEVRNILPHYRWGAIRLFNEYCFGKDIPVDDPSFMPEPVYRQTFLWLQKGCRVIIDRLKTNSLDYDDCK